MSFDDDFELAEARKVEAWIPVTRELIYDSPNIEHVPPRKATRRERRKARGAVGREWCEHPGCGRRLHPWEVHEMRHHPGDALERALGRGGGGGTYMAETFCAEHCPHGDRRRLTLRERWAVRRAIARFRRQDA